MTTDAGLSDLAAELEADAKSIASYLSRLVDDGSFASSRSFYGETFSLALLGKVGYLDPARKVRLVQWYQQKDKKDPEFHWEFNVYALSEFLKSVPGRDPEIESILATAKFKGTQCTNWTLLRINASLNSTPPGHGRDTLLAEAHRKLAARQKRSGLIEDDPGVRSFQYHAFSLCMVYEIYKKTHQKFFLDSFRKGIEFSRRFILSSGESLYIGRGQNQSFGYAALLYALAASFDLEREPGILGDIAHVLSYLRVFKRQDGSFPLVMLKTERGFPDRIDVSRAEFFGWYPYNNYLDYLPFLGFFVKKASNLVARNIGRTRFPDAEGKVGVVYSDRDFLVYRNSQFEAVIGRPGGYTSNDMSIPYLLMKGRNTASTPCYGGEQFLESIYRPQGHPLPYFPHFRKNISWRSKSCLIGRWLIIFSPLGVVIRRYSFEARRARVWTFCLSPFRFEHAYLVKPDSNDAMNMEIRGDHAENVDLQYSASGPLKRLAAKGFYSSVDIKVLDI